MRDQCPDPRPKQRAVEIARRRRGFISGSGPPSFAAIKISRPNLEKSFALCASAFPFLCLIFAHLECPAMILPFNIVFSFYIRLIFYDKGVFHKFLVFNAAFVGFLLLRGI